MSGNEHPEFGPESERLGQTIEAVKAWRKDRAPSPDSDPILDAFYAKAVDEAEPLEREPYFAAWM